MNTYLNNIRNTKLLELKSTNSYILIMLSFFIPLSTAIPSILSALFIIIWLFIGNFKEDWNNLKNNKVVISILLFILLQLFALFWSQDIMQGLTFSIKKESRLLLIPLFMLFTKKEHIPYYIYAFLVGMMLSEITTYAIFFKAIEPFGHASLLLPSPFIGHISYTPILTMAIYITLHYLLFATNLSKLQKVGYILFSITMSINMFIAGGRAGQVMFFAMLVILLFQYFKNQILKPLLISAIAIPSIFATFYITTPNFQDRVDMIFSDINKYNENKNTSLGLRFTFTMNSLQIIKENPFFGVGTGSFKNQYEKVNSRLSPDAIPTQNPHNMYIFELVEVGFIGLFSMLSILFFQIKHALRAKEKLIKDLGLALPLLFMVIMISESYLIIVNTAFLFALFSSFLYKEYEILNQVKK